MATHAANIKESPSMTAAQADASARNVITIVVTWLRLLGLLALALLVSATLAAMLGHPIPYIPAIKGSMQEIGIFTACLAYWLK